MYVKEVLKEYGVYSNKSDKKEIEKFTAIEQEIAKRVLGLLDPIWWEMQL